MKNGLLASRRRTFGRIKRIAPAIDWQAAINDDNEINEKKISNRP